MLKIFGRLHSSSSCSSMPFNSSPVSDPEVFDVSPDSRLLGLGRWGRTGEVSPGVWIWCSCWADACAACMRMLARLARFSLTSVSRRRLVRELSSVLSNVVEWRLVTSKWMIRQEVCEVMPKRPRTFLERFAIASQSRRRCGRDYQAWQQSPAPWSTADAVWSWT